MTEFSDLLRAAADQMPDNADRGSRVVARGLRRRRRDRALVAVVAVAVVAGASVLVREVAFEDAAAVAPAKITTVPSVTPDQVTPTLTPTLLLTPSSPPSPLPPTGDGPAVAPVAPVAGTTAPPRPSDGSGGQRVRLGVATFTLPVGWEVLQHDERPGGTTPDGQGYPASEHMCIGPSGGGGAAAGGYCPGLALSNGVAFGNENRLFWPDQPAGWHVSTGVMVCPVGPVAFGPDGVNAANPGSPDAPGASDVVASSDVTVAGLSARYDRWIATCDDGRVFTPESWYVGEPVLQVLDVLSHPESADVVSSIAVGW